MNETLSPRMMGSNKHTVSGTLSKETPNVLRNSKNQSSSITPRMLGNNSSRLRNSKNTPSGDMISFVSF